MVLLLSLPLFGFALFMTLMNLATSYNSQEARSLGRAREGHAIASSLFHGMFLAGLFLAWNR